MRVFTLISLNILCGTFFQPFPFQRHMRQAKLIQIMKPDIICLQEFNNLYIESIYKTVLSNSYILLVDRVRHNEYIRRLMILLLITIIISQISHLLFFLFIICFLNPYVHNFIIGNQKTGNVIFIKKIFEQQISFITTEFTYQNGDPLNIFRKRGFIECIFNNLQIRNIHLNHGINQKKQMTECLNGLLPNTILLGDFNTESIISTELKDVGKLLGPTYRKDNPLVSYYHSKSERIDFILTRGIKVLEVKKLKNLESDHDGFFLKFTLDFESI